jgi:hypothetical protein
LEAFATRTGIKLIDIGQIADAALER